MAEHRKDPLDETKLFEMEPGVADPRMNNLTPEQFAAQTRIIEQAITMAFLGNDNMKATALMELTARMVLDYDEAGSGDELLAQFHAGLDFSVAKWRTWLTAQKAKMNAHNGTEKLN